MKYSYYNKWLWIECRHGINFDDGSVFKTYKKNWESYAAYLNKQGTDENDDLINYCVCMRLIYIF